MMVPVESGEVWSDDSGQPAGGDDVPLLLLHPGVGDSSVWDKVRPQWTERYRVVRYDTRGYGQSPDPTVRYSAMADALAVMDHYGLSTVHLVGSSMGGGNALSIALTHPERVASLVLICPGIGGYPYPSEPELDAEFEAAEQAGDREAIARLGLRVWAGAGADEEVTRLLRGAVRGWFNDWTWEQSDPPTFDRLGEITAPTVIMVGDLDRPALVESNRQAAERIPGARLVWLPGVDHFPPIRVPDLVARTVLEHCVTR